MPAFARGGSGELKNNCRNQKNQKNQKALFAKTSRLQKCSHGLPKKTFKALSRQHGKPEAMNPFQLLVLGCALNAAAAALRVPESPDALNSISEPLLPVRQPAKRRRRAPEVGESSRVYPEEIKCEHRTGQARTHACMHARALTHLPSLPYLFFLFCFTGCTVCLPLLFL